MSREDMKVAAVSKFLGSLTPGTSYAQKFTGSFTEGFDAGFDAGAASRWVKIEGEADLPKDEAEYLTRDRGGMRTVMKFSNHPDSRVVWLKFIAAYMPIPEYQEENR